MDVCVLGHINLRTKVWNTKNSIVSIFFGSKNIIQRVFIFPIYNEIIFV